MKKINKLIPFVLSLPLLFGCSSQTGRYSGEKIILDYVSNGGVVNATAQDMYDDVLTYKKSTIYLVGISSCGGCRNAKRILQSYCENNHCNVYYIDYDTVLKNNKTNFAKVQEATKSNDSSTMLKEEDSYPAIFFYLKGEVAFRTGETDLEHYLTTYVSVATPSN